MEQDVLRISQICCARAIVACGEQFVKSKLIRKIRKHSIASETLYTKDSRFRDFLILTKF